VIDCKDFQFATASLTGGPWFYQTIMKYGIEDSEYYGGVLGKFKKIKDGHKLKVTLVRNPCDWLGLCYKMLLSDCLSGTLKKFKELNTESLYEFANDYLDKMPGEISRLFFSYEADSYMRIEDMPWAMLEFLEMLGHDVSFRSFPKIPIQSEFPRIDNEFLRQRVMKAEKGITDAFDYY